MDDGFEKRTLLSVPYTNVVSGPSLSSFSPTQGFWKHPKDKRCTVLNRLRTVNLEPDHLSVDPVTLFSPQSPRSRFQFHQRSKYNETDATKLWPSTTSPQPIWLILTSIPSGSFLYQFWVFVEPPDPFPPVWERVSDEGVLPMPRVTLTPSPGVFLLSKRPGREFPEWQTYPSTLDKSATTFIPTSLLCSPSPLSRLPRVWGVTLSGPDLNTRYSRCCCYREYTTYHTTCVSREQS